MRRSLALAGVALAAIAIALAQQAPVPVSFSGTVLNTAKVQIQKLSKEPQ
jgi:hypothetical protein